ncbi:MAG: aminotransferase class I/II-fold pyridoxal phosphate-dependent enzyme, partial [Bacteroidota bacterium]
TGTYFSKKEIEELIYHLPDHVILVYDEVYYHFTDAEDYTTALPYVLEGKNIIAINSFSKAYGLAALRIGYSYSTPEIATYLRNIRRPFMINTLSMEAAIAALEDTDFIAQSRDFVHQEKAFLYAQFDRLGIQYWKTQANFILVKVPMEANICEHEMLKDGIMVRVANGFPKPNYVRITIGTRKANETVVAAISKILVVLSK